MVYLLSLTWLDDSSSSAFAAVVLKAGADARLSAPQASIGYGMCLAEPGYTNRHGWPNGPFDICGVGMYKSTVGKKNAHSSALSSTVCM